jgi:hypothetical protein
MPKHKERAPVIRLRRALYLKQITDMNRSPTDRSHDHTVVHSAQTRLNS